MNATGYVRVSDSKQEASGLSLQGQREIVTAFAAQRGMKLTRIFVETESGRRADNRPELQAALRECRETGNTLIISRLDRLGRNASFLMSLRDSNVSFQCCDLPDCNRMTIGVLACVAEQESESISVRTATALRVMKAKAEAAGTEFFAGQRAHCRRAYPAAVAARKQNSANRILARRRGILAVFNTTGERRYLTTANLLNELGVPSVTGAGKWYPASVKRIVEFREG